jgi:hypothetical protein
MGVIWEDNFLTFMVITVILGGGAALLSGRAMARGWRPFWHLIFFMLLLTCAVRFFHYALFGGALLSLRYFAVDAAVLIFCAATGFHLTRVKQMVTQYHWLYERHAVVFWRRRDG